MLGLGETAPAAFPVQVSIEGYGPTLHITVDGQTHTLSSVLGPEWLGVSVEQPGPTEREYQVDGSDTTSTQDRQGSVIARLLNSPLYRFDVWLRDESSYSRWERVRILDLTSGQPVAAGSSVLPNDFRIEAALRRPEAPARLWLDAAGDRRREGLEIDRDRRNARWLIQRGGTTDPLPRWFFPEQPAPFAAELLHLLGRAAAAGFALVIVALVAAAATRKFPLAQRFDLRPGLARLVPLVILAAWLVAAALVTTDLYHQRPHILDAVSYTFQAGLFAAGAIALDAPPLVAAFEGPFEVLWQGRLFSQYPPGAPAAHALGQLVGLSWLVGPVACVALIGVASWTAGALFGRVCGLAVLCLGALSPFILFQAGSFLSHPIAGALLAGALAAFVAGERDGRERWYALCGLLLGASFVTREAASILFALPLGARLVTARRWDAAQQVVAYGLPFVALYLAYNSWLTGSPTLLPRSLFDASDRFGFGDGIGFHNRHTLAAGLANTDEMLTLLQLDLFGWPPLFALGLLCVPFLVGRAQAWDVLAAAGVFVFLVAYAAYFYHGIALGPRYYFEALPWLLLLAGRGAQILAELARSRLVVVGLLGLLSLNTVLFYVPLEIERRADFSGMPGGRTVSLDFVHTGIFGPHLDNLPSPALVVTDDWWLYNTALAALNCARLPNCPVLFALATNADDVNRLRAAFPDRAMLRTVDDAGRIHVEPGA